MFSPLSEIHNLDWFMYFLTRISIGFQKIQMLRARFKNYISIKKSGFSGEGRCVLRFARQQMARLTPSLGLSKFVLAIDQSSKPGTVLVK